MLTNLSWGRDSRRTHWQHSFVEARNEFMKRARWDHTAVYDDRRSSARWAAAARSSHSQSVVDVEQKVSE